MRKISPSIYSMTFQDFHPISFFCTAKHYRAQEACLPAMLFSFWGSRMKRTSSHSKILLFSAVFSAIIKIFYCIVMGILSIVMWPFLGWLNACCERQLISLSLSYNLLVPEWLASCWPPETHQNTQRALHWQMCVCSIPADLIWSMCCSICTHHFNFTWTC